MIINAESSYDERSMAIYIQFYCSLQLQTKSAENLPELENKIQQTIHRIIPIKELPQKLSSSFSTCVRIQTIKSSKPT